MLIDMNEKFFLTILSPSYLPVKKDCQASSDCNDALTLTFQCCSSLNCLVAMECLCVSIKKIISVIKENRF